MSDSSFQGDRPVVVRAERDRDGIELKPWILPAFTELPFRRTLGSQTISPDNPAPGSFYAPGQVPGGGGTPTPSKTPSSNS